MSAKRSILSLIFAIATITATAADIRESRATTESGFSGLCRSDQTPLAATPSSAPSSWKVHAAAPGFRTHTRPQKQSARGKTTSSIPSGKAPKTGRQLEAEPAPSAEAPAPTTAPTAATPPMPRGTSARQRHLTPDLALVHPLPSITGPGSCGAEDVVRLEAVVLESGQHVGLVPAATLRCPMAEAVARWIREKVAPAAVGTFGSAVSTVATAGSYECRERDRVPGAKLSEHSRANALDLRGLKLANGTAVDLTDKGASKEFRELVRQSACATFTTVLGPGSDASHADNIHLDLIERKGGYRICEWDVLTMPELGSTLPPEHPRASNGTN